MTETKSVARRAAPAEDDRPYALGADMGALPVEDDEPVARPGDERPAEEDEPELREAEAPTDPKAALPSVEERIPDAERGGPPAWAKVPKGMRFPRGTRPIFVRFRPEWTRAPHKGERQCILWELTDLDEHAAAQRAAGFPGRGLQEFAKGTIRAIDGEAVEWSGAEGAVANIDQFWRDIGPKGRSMIVGIYQQTHAMSPSERVDFFMNCIAARSVG
jgi:hypothetical protein